ncbi:MAG: flavodoxin family protein [Chitinispirillaceae bacterium]
MKIGIVVHTSSGHTLTFARAVESKLKSRGHQVDVLGLRTIGAVTPGSRSKFELKSPPELDEYDLVMVGGPVWAFKASPVIMKFLAQVKSLKGKKALSFVTMGLPFKFTGGERAIRMMNEELEASGADVLSGEMLHYMFKTDQKKLEEAVERICSAVENN